MCNTSEHSHSLGIILFLILHFKYYWNLNNKDGGFLKVKKKNKKHERKRREDENVV